MNRLEQILERQEALAKRLLKAGKALTAAEDEAAQLPVEAAKWPNRTPEKRKPCASDRTVFEEARKEEAGSSDMGEATAFAPIAFRMPQRDVSDRRHPEHVGIEEADARSVVASAAQTTDLQSQAEALSRVYARDARRYGQEE